MSRITKIGLPLYNIEIQLSPSEDGQCGQIVSSDLIPDSEVDIEGNTITELGAALAAIESLILSHACAGVNVVDPRYLDGIETTVDAVYINS